MATNSFQEGMQSGAALFAPFAQAQAQVNQLRIAQQQELARRLFAQQQLDQQLAARQAISNNELAARENLQKAQQLFAAKQAEEDRLARANEREADRDFLVTQNQEKQDQAFRDQQDSIKRNTKFAQGAINTINNLNNQVSLFLQPNDSDKELAISQALSFVDTSVKRLASNEETPDMFVARAAKADPEFTEAYQASLANIVAKKAERPEIESIQNEVRLYSDLVSQAARSGMIDPSVLFTQQQPAQGDSDPMAAFADLLNESLTQGAQPPSQPASGAIPATPGLFVTAPRVIAEGVGGAIQGIGGLVEDARRGLFGQSAVSESDITDTKQFAESIGVTGQEFDLLSNDEKRELNQRRIKSNASKQAPKKPSSFVPILGF